MNDHVTQYLTCSTVCAYFRVESKRNDFL